MTVNKNHPHLLVLPEDRANLQLANGFHQQVEWTNYRQMQVLRAAGGWMEVLELFESEHLPELSRYPHRHMALLIDFDAAPGRLTQAKRRVPAPFGDRVFILGVLTEPEALKGDLARPYEEIGAELAKNAARKTTGIGSIRYSGTTPLNFNVLESVRGRFCSSMPVPQRSTVEGQSGSREKHQRT